MCVAPNLSADLDVKIDQMKPIEKDMVREPKSYIEEMLSVFPDSESRHHLDINLYEEFDFVLGPELSPKHSACTAQEVQRDLANGSELGAPSLANDGVGLVYGKAALIENQS